MARSEAQREANKRYKKTHPPVCVSWGTRLKPDDAAELEALIKEAGFKGRAAFLHWAVEQRATNSGCPFLLSEEL